MGGQTGLTQAILGRKIRTNACTMNVGLNKSFPLIINGTVLVMPICPSVSYVCTFVCLLFPCSDTKTAHSIHRSYHDRMHQSSLSAHPVVHLLYIRLLISFDPCALLRMLFSALPSRLCPLEAWWERFTKAGQEVERLHL